MNNLFMSFSGEVATSRNSPHRTGSEISPLNDLATIVQAAFPSCVAQLGALCRDLAFTSGPASPCPAVAHASRGSRGPGP